MSNKKKENRLFHVGKGVKTDNRLTPYVASRIPIWIRMQKKMEKYATVKNMVEMALL